MKLFATCALALVAGDFALAFTAPLVARGGTRSVAGPSSATTSVCMSANGEVCVCMRSLSTDMMDVAAKSDLRRATTAWTRSTTALCFVVREHLFLRRELVIAFGDYLLSHETERTTQDHSSRGNHAAVHLAQFVKYHRALAMVMRIPRASTCRCRASSLCCVLAVLRTCKCNSIQSFRGTKEHDPPSTNKYVSQ